MVVTFATHMALRKLIAPAEMGVWTWAEPVFILLAQVRDLGVPGHVVRQSRRAYGNYLGLQIGWGGALAAALAIGAPLLALGFAGRDDATVPILRALCLFLFVQGLGSVPLTFFEAEQAIEKTIPAELGRNVCFAALSLFLAFRGWGVWSIVIAHITAAALYSAMLWWAALSNRASDDAPGHERLDLERLPNATLPLVIASLPLMVMSVLELAVLNLDPVVLGLRLPAAVVGAAGLAILAAFFVSRQLADAAGRAVYPALVRYRDQPARAFEVFRVATLFLLTLVVPVAFFVFWNAERVVIILTLGRSDWLAAADYLRVAAFVPLARPLTMFGRELLLVYHRDRLLIVYTLANLLALGGLGYVLIGTDLRELGMAVAGYFPLGMLILAWGLWQLERNGLQPAAARHRHALSPRAGPLRPDRAGARGRALVAILAVRGGGGDLRRPRAAAPPRPLSSVPRVRLTARGGILLRSEPVPRRERAPTPSLPTPSTSRRISTTPRSRAARRSTRARGAVSGSRSSPCSRARRRPMRGCRRSPRSFIVCGVSISPSTRSPSGVTRTASAAERLGAVAVAARAARRDLPRRRARRAALPCLRFAVSRAARRGRRARGARARRARRSTRERFVAAPLAIGSHVDHRIVHQAARATIDRRPTLVLRGLSLRRELARAPARQRRTSWLGDRSRAGGRRGPRPPSAPPSPATPRSSTSRGAMATRASVAFAASISARGGERLWRP